MKKLTLLFISILSTQFAFGQDAKTINTYGGIPTANENMQWHDDVTPEEKYIGVIKIDSLTPAYDIIEAFMVTFQPLQDANIMTKQMRANNAWGGALSVVNGDYESVEHFSKAGDSDSRDQNRGRTSWTVQFIDGVRLNRFYYNVAVQAKDGRYKLTVTPAGSSGYGNDHIQKEWSQMFKNGNVKSNQAKYYDQMKTKLAFTIDQWINAVEIHLTDSLKDSW